MKLTKKIPCNCSSTSLRGSIEHSKALVLSVLTEQHVDVMLRVAKKPHSV